MTTMRLWFTKTGEASYISLLDLQRVMQRAFKRAGLPVWYTQGFNPHIYMTFSAPLALGLESVCESLDFKTEDDTFDWAGSCAAFTACLPHGITALKFEPAKMDPARIAAAHYVWRVRAEAQEQANRAAAIYNQAQEVNVEKKSKHKKVKRMNLKQYLPVLEWKTGDKGVLETEMTLPAGSVLTISPALVLSWLCENSKLELWQVQILRDGLFANDGTPFA